MSPTSTGVLQPAPDRRRQHHHLVHPDRDGRGDSRARSSPRSRRPGRCRRRPPRRPAPTGSRTRSPSRSAPRSASSPPSRGRVIGVRSESPPGPGWVWTLIMMPPIPGLNRACVAAFGFLLNRPTACSRRRFPDHHVVDQPRAPDPRGDGDQHGPPVEALARGQVVGVARLDVLGLDPGRGELAAGRCERGAGGAVSPRRTAAAAALRAAAAAPPRARAPPRSGRRCASSSRARRARARSARRRSRPRSRGRATIRSTTTACWASFWPKKATSGPTVLNSFATTVVTPRKCSGPRRCGSPSSTSVSAPPTSTSVANPSG